MSSGSALVLGLLLALSACAGCRGGTEGKAQPEVKSAGPLPFIDGQPWVIAQNPDLGALTGAQQQPVDFALWQAADGSWQLWSCIRGTEAPGVTRLFYRWEGKQLTDHDWEPKGIALEADTNAGEWAGGLQAPFVLKVGDTWHMLYGDYEHICHATSRDGKTFKRVLDAHGKSGRFSEGWLMNTRDPMVLRSDDALFRVYYTDVLGAVYMRSSRDLHSFGEARRVAYGGSAGYGWSSSECPFVVRPAHGGPYFLFRTQRYGADAQTSVYRSDTPDAFGINDDRQFVKRLPIAAPELVEHEGNWYIAYLLPNLQGIQLARLRWR